MGTSVNTQPDRTEASQARRALRFHRQSIARGLTDNKRVKGCMHWLSGAAEGQVAMKLNDDVAHFHGLQHCGHMWDCMVCSATLRHYKSLEIEQAVKNWLASGGAIAFVTLTVKHSQGDNLAHLLDAVMKSWQRGVVSGAAWKADKRKWGVKGFVRSVEITYGHATGWHPHIHALLFLKAKLPKVALDALGERMFGRWERAAVRYGVGRPSREAFFIRPVTNDNGISAYLSKVQDEHGDERAAALELARGDLKQGRHGERLLPFQLIDAIEDGEAWAFGRWAEYVKATSGRRAVTWSRGIRSMAGLDEVELSDEEIVGQDVGGQVELMIPGVLWRKVLRHRGARSTLLDLLERHGAAGARAYLYSIDHAAPPDDG